MRVRKISEIVDHEVSGAASKAVSLSSFIGADVWRSCCSTHHEAQVGLDSRSIVSIALVSFQKEGVIME